MRIKLFLLLSFFVTAAQENKPIDDKIKIEVLQTKIENLQRQVEDYKLHAKELNDTNKDEIEKLLQQKEEALDSRMQIYVSIFVAAFLIVLGFFRWLGKSEIRKIVDKQAVKQLDKQLKIKLSKEVIDEKLTALGKPIIGQILEDISASKIKAKVSADELEESNKLYKKLLKELSLKPKNDETSESTPEEKAKVKEFTDVLDKVKNEEEFTEKDWYMKSQEAFNTKNYEKVIEYCTESLKISEVTSDAFYAFYYRALSYYHLNKSEEALRDINLAIELETKDFAFFVRTLILEEMERYNEAIADIDMAIEINPDYALAFDVRKRIIEKMKNKGISPKNPK